MPTTITTSTAICTWGKAGEKEALRAQVEIEGGREGEGHK